MKENLCLKSLWDEREQVAIAAIKSPKRTKPLANNFGRPLLEITTAKERFLH